MVTRLLLCAIMALMGSTCFAKGRCTEPTEYQPSLCPIKLPRIVSIQIEDNGARMPKDAEPQIDCSKFKLTITGVRRFFTKAMQADEADAHHTLTWTPCYASGTLRFADGRTAQWGITLTQTGALTIDGESRLFLYCPSCKFKPFVW